MISYLIVKNYKIIQDQTLSLTALNIFTGINSTGKSSFIQSLLLLRQSYQQGFLTNVNGAKIFLGEVGRDNLVQPGNVGEVFNINTANDKGITFFITDEQGVQYGFESKNYDQLNLSSHSLEGTFTLPPPINNIPLFNDRFQYLSAHRIEPAQYYPGFTYDGQRYLGVDGRFAPAYLERYGYTPIAIKALTHPDSSSDSLKEQTIYWLRNISKGINIKVKKLGGGDIEMNYTYTDNGTPTHDIKPQNVGFGLTYSLPIIVAILSAQPNDLILIENPETHLHPYGQARLIELMALAAQNGVQIIIETHSDHIVNGTFVACKRFEKNPATGIDKKNANIFYFERTGIKNKITQIPILAGGKTNYPPIGFFDQTEKDIAEILEF